MKKTPVFVYGTLREGFGNYMRILKGKASEPQKATLDGFEMYSVGGFPAIMPGEGQVIGEVMYLNEDQYERTMLNLDGLEGYYPQRENYSMYLRRTMTVTLENGEKVDAYVYLWNRPIPGPKVESGDWKEYTYGTNPLNFVDEEEDEMLPI
jgi:gamma-glutamylcyclotransferase (GGCT)/AIG2-like uncharacterized protein YtfP